MKDKNIELQNLVNEVKIKNLKLDQLYNETIVKIVKIFRKFPVHISPIIIDQTERVRSLGKLFIKDIKNISIGEAWDIMRALDIFNLGLSFVNIPEEIEITEKNLKILYSNEELKYHNVTAARMLEDIPGLEGVASIIKFYQKDYDGSGAPFEVSIKGEAIPFGSRLLKILINLDCANPGLLIDSKTMEYYKNHVVKNKNSANITDSSKPLFNYIQKHIRILEEMTQKPSHYDVKLVQEIIEILK